MVIDMESEIMLWDGVEFLWLYGREFARILFLRSIDLCSVISELFFTFNKYSASVVCS